MTYKEVLNKVARQRISNPYTGGQNAAARQADMRNQIEMQKRVAGQVPQPPRPRIPARSSRRAFDANSTAFTEQAAKWRQQMRATQSRTANSSQVGTPTRSFR